MICPPTSAFRLFETWPKQIKLVPQTKMVNVGTWYVIRTLSKYKNPIVKNLSEDTEIKQTYSAALDFLRLSLDLMLNQTGSIKGC